MEEQKDSIKSRLKTFIGSMRMSVRSFESQCDLGNSFVNHIGKSIGSDKLERILREFPNLNKDWLLNGTGEMILLSPVKNIVELNTYKGIQVYDLDATCGTDNRDISFVEDNIIGYVDLPNLRPDCKIVRANGDSMNPVIIDGNWIAIHEIFNFEDIFYGQIYLILTEDYRMVKYIRRYEQDEDNYIILRSANKEYDDIRMQKSKIRKLFIVESILSVKIQL
jgi:hypothetical protein